MAYLQRYDLFIEASRLLHRYLEQTPECKPRALEVALAVQYFQADIPEVGQIGQKGSAQSHLSLEDLALFNQDSHGMPRALLLKDHTRWHKASNGQQGIGCHAQALNFWKNIEFLESDRDLCPFRVYDTATPLTIDQGRQKCGFDGNPCGWQPGLPKFLQILGRGIHAEVHRGDWSPVMWHYLVPAYKPLPFYPLAQFIYFGNQSLQKGRSTISPEEMREDLHFSEALWLELFDMDPENPLNKIWLNEAQYPPQLADDEHPYPLKSLQMPQKVDRPRPHGGRLVLDPEESPQYQRSGIPAALTRDPLLAERRRRRQLERTAEHDQILKKFRRWFRLAGKEVREDADTFDFLAVDESLVLLAEVKLLGQQDMAEIIQETLGQLLYYERFALAPWKEAGYPVYKAAVFDRPPLGDYAAFFADLDIHVFWLDSDGRIDGMPEGLKLLEHLGVEVRMDPELAC
jgi:hypothetical protein